MKKRIATAFLGVIYSIDLYYACDGDRESKNER